MSPLLYYAAGAILGIIGIASGQYLLYGIVSASLITAHPMSRLLSSAGFGWYAYFTLIDVALGVYLIAQDSNLVRLAGAVSILAGILTISCSRWPNWIHHNYEILQAVTTTTFFWLMALAAIEAGVGGLR